MNYITVVRGRLKGSPEQAKAAHDGTVEQLSVMTRPMGAISHRPHLNPKEPQRIPGDRYMEQPGRPAEVHG